jgi:hypothetical protein
MTVERTSKKAAEHQENAAENHEEKATEHHEKAAKHNEKAAQHHREAAKHERGDHEAAEITPTLRMGITSMRPAIQRMPHNDICSSMTKRNSTFCRSTRPRILVKSVDTA